MAQKVAKFLDGFQLSGTEILLEAEGKSLSEVWKSVSKHGHDHPEYHTGVVDIAGQDRLGIVKGSDTVIIEEGGILHAAPAEAVGSMKLWHEGTTPPAGWEFANGGTVSVAAYPDLFALIGQKYSPAGTAEGMFCLPTVPETKTYGEWVSTGITTGMAALATNTTTGDMYCAGNGTQVMVLRGGVGTWEPTGSIASNWYSIVVNPVSGDVWACVNGGAIYVLHGGIGTWEKTNSGNAGWTWIAIHTASGDVWACASNASTHVLRGGVGNWTSTGGPACYVVVCDQITGDVFAGTSSSGGVYVLRGGIGAWANTGAPNGIWRGGFAHSTTSDIYMCAPLLSIYVLRGGTGAWHSVSPAGPWHSVAVDTFTADIWGSEYNGANVDGVRVLNHGDSQWVGTNSGNSAWMHVLLHPLTRHIWAVSHTSGVFMLPIRRIQTIIKVQ